MKAEIVPARATCRLILSIVACSLIVASAGAQPMGQSLYDLEFEVINATTGQPGSIDRLQIHYFAVASDKVIEVEPSGSSFSLPRVPIFTQRAYLVTAWKNGVPYYWQLRGSKLTDETTKLHVFDTSDSLDAVTIEGLTMIVNRTESLLELEYMLSVSNAARPQVTVVRPPGTVEIALPAGASDLAAEYQRGPEPTTVPVKSLGGGRVVLDVPLTSGNNRIKLTGVVAWTDNMTVPVAFNLPVKSWSLLASPESMVVQAYELENDLDNSLPGHQRLRGPELEAGRQFEFRLIGGAPAGQVEDLFTTDAPADSLQDEGTGDQTDGDQGGPPYMFIVLGAVVIAAVLVVVRRRS